MTDLAPALRRCRAGDSPRRWPPATLLAPRRCRLGRALRLVRAALADRPVHGGRHAGRTRLDGGRGDRRLWLRHRRLGPLAAAGGIPRGSRLRRAGCGAAGGARHVHRAAGGRCLVLGRRDDRTGAGGARKRARSALALRAPRRDSTWACDHRQDAAFTLFTCRSSWAPSSPRWCAGRWGRSSVGPGGSAQRPPRWRSGLGLLLVYPNGPLPGREQRTAGAAGASRTLQSRGTPGRAPGRGRRLRRRHLARLRACCSATDDGESTLDLLIQGGAVTAFGFLLAPVFAWLWVHLGRRGRDLRIGTKLVLGMVPGLRGSAHRCARMPSSRRRLRSPWRRPRGAACWKAAGLLCLYADGALGLHPAGADLVARVLRGRLVAGDGRRSRPGCPDWCWSWWPGSSAESGGWRLAAALLLIATMAVLGRRLEPRAAREAARSLRGAPPRLSR